MPFNARIYSIEFSALVYNNGGDTVFKGAFQHSNYCGNSL